MTKFGDSDVVENENNVLIALSQILRITNKNQSKLECGSSCSLDQTEIHHMTLRLIMLMHNKEGTNPTLYFHSPVDKAALSFQSGLLDKEDAVWGVV